jgi:hypothetical protein
MEAFNRLLVIEMFFIQILGPQEGDDVREGPKKRRASRLNKRT